MPRSLLRALIRTVKCSLVVLARQPGEVTRRELVFLNLCGASGAPEDRLTGRATVRKTGDCRSSQVMSVSAEASADQVARRPSVDPSYCSVYHEANSTRSEASDPGMSALITGIRGQI